MDRLPGFQAIPVGWGYTDGEGRIQLNTSILDTTNRSVWSNNQPGGITDLAIEAASELVHEAVESYHVVQNGIGATSYASQHMDYVAQWFKGKIVNELNRALCANGEGCGHADPGQAFGVDFRAWTKTGDWLFYKDQDVDQKELTNPAWALVGWAWGAHLMSDPWSDEMGLTVNMLRAQCVSPPCSAN